NRTSPVQRGKWVLENILGTPPPPPPGNVPLLTEDNPVGTVLTMRERMEQHRANPACAGCHRLMDPIGLSFEHFDATGRWRTRNGGGRARAGAGARRGGPVSRGGDALKRAFRPGPELFVTPMTKKLLTCARGRGGEPPDAPAVRAIARDARADNYRFSSLILGI